MALKAETWFPSVIWSGLANGLDNNALESFAYELKDKDKGVQISNYLGWQSNPIAYGTSTVFDNFVTHLNTQISECCKDSGLPEVELYNIWVNINPKGAYNHLHNHAGALLSGVYYVKSEEGNGNIFFERSDNAEYFLPPLAQPNYFTSTATTYKSITSALYIFPAWLKHSVQPNMLDSDRISISFNYGVKT